MCLLTQEWGRAQRAFVCEHMHSGWAAKAKAKAMERSGFSPACFLPGVSMGHSAYNDQSSTNQTPHWRLQRQVSEGQHKALGEKREEAANSCHNI